MYIVSATALPDSHGAEKKLTVKVRHDCHHVCRLVTVTRVIVTQLQSQSEASEKTFMDASQPNADVQDHANLQLPMASNYSALRKSGVMFLVVSVRLSVSQQVISKNAINALIRRAYGC